MIEYDVELVAFAGLCRIDFFFKRAATTRQSVFSC